MFRKPEGVESVGEVDRPTARIMHIVSPIRTLLRFGLEIERQPFAEELVEKPSFLIPETGQLFLPGQEDRKGIPIFPKL